MYSDPTCRALIEAIRAAPEDDLPRLALADRLEEIGGEAGLLRARLIRGMIASPQRLPLPVGKVLDQGLKLWAEASGLFASGAHGSFRRRGRTVRGCIAARPDGSWHWGTAYLSYERGLAMSVSFWSVTFAAFLGPALARMEPTATFRCDRWSRPCHRHPDDFFPEDRACRVISQPAANDPALCYRAFWLLEGASVLDELGKHYPARHGDSDSVFRARAQRAGARALTQAIREEAGIT